jgi:hypothetical protein
VSGDDIRASDADRGRSADLLAEQAGTGRITASELEDRIGRAYQAVSLGELRGLFSDLPVDPGVPVDPHSAAAVAKPDGDSWQAKLKDILPGHVTPAVIALIALAGVLAITAVSVGADHRVAPLGLFWIIFWIAGPAWHHHHRHQ